MYHSSHLNSSYQGLHENFIMISRASRLCLGTGRLQSVFKPVDTKWTISKRPPKRRQALPPHCSHRQPPAEPMWQPPPPAVPPPSPPPAMWASDTKQGPVLRSEGGGTPLPQQWSKALPMPWPWFRPLCCENQYCQKKMQCQPWHRCYHNCKDAWNVSDHWPAP